MSGMAVAGMMWAKSRALQVLRDWKGPRGHRASRVRRVLPARKGFKARKGRLARRVHRA